VIKVFLTVHTLPVAYVSLGDRYVVEKVETIPGAFLFLFLLCVL